MISNQERLSAEDKLFMLLNKPQFDSQIRVSLYVAHTEWEREIRKDLTSTEIENMETKRNILLKDIENTPKEHANADISKDVEESFFNIYKTIFMEILVNKEDLYEQIINFIKLCKKICNKNYAYKKYIKYQLIFFFNKLIPFKAHFLDIYNIIDNGELVPSHETYLYYFTMYGNCIKPLLTSEDVSKAVKDATEVLPLIVYYLYLLFIDDKTEESFNQFIEYFIDNIGYFANSYYIIWCNKHDIVSVIKKLYDDGSVLSYPYLSKDNIFVPTINNDDNEKNKINNYVTNEYVNITINNKDKEPVCLIGDNIFNTEDGDYISYYVRSKILSLDKSDIADFVPINNKDLYILTENEMGLLKKREGIKLAKIIDFNNRKNSRVIGNYKGDLYLFIKPLRNNKIYGIGLESSFNDNGYPLRKVFLTTVHNNVRYEVGVE